MSELATIILAAGKGTRMNSDLPKVLHRINGKPMINYVIQSAQDLGSHRIIVVVGHQHELVKTIVRNDFSHNRDKMIEFVTQKSQLGTAHAVLQTAWTLKEFEGNVLVLSGDVPLIRSETLKEMLKIHHQTNAICTVMTSITDNPTGYGRIIRSFDGMLDKIVEEKDIQTDDIRNINEINCGIYLFRAENLFTTLPKVDNDNKQQEYYLPDVIKIMIQENMNISVFQVDDMSETHGINTPEQLKEIEKLMKTK